MKKVLFLIALLVPMACLATDIPSPSTPKILFSDGTVNGIKTVSPTNPLPVTAVLATDSISLVVTVASITAKLIDYMLQDATQTITIGNAIASIPAKLIEFMAQQAAECATATLNAAAIETAITNYAAQDATQTDDIVNAVASVATAVLSTPTVKIDQTTGGVTNGVDPAVNSQASATANPTLAGAVMLYLTDNSQLQRWFTALVQTDGVNGNNMGSFAGWQWNGATFDRVRGTTSGTYVLSTLATDSISLVVTIASVTAKLVDLMVQQAAEQATVTINLGLIETAVNEAQEYIASVTAKVAELMVQQAAEAATDTLSLAAIETAVDENTAAAATNTDDIVTAINTAATTSSTLTSESIGLMTGIYSVATEVSDLAAQSATETDDIVLAIQTAASDTAVDLTTDSIGLVTGVYAVATEVSDLAAQQATETDDIVLAVQTAASDTHVDLTTDSIGLLTGVYSVATGVSNLAAQIASEAIDTLAYLASITTAITSTPTVLIGAGTSTLGSVTALIPSPSKASQTIVLLTSTPQAIVAFAGRKYVSLSATGTFEFEYGSTGVTADTVPCYNDSRAMDDTVSLWVSTTATETKLTVRQDGN